MFLKGLNESRRVWDEGYLPAVKTRGRVLLRSGTRCEKIDDSFGVLKRSEVCCFLQFSPPTGWPQAVCLPGGVASGECGPSRTLPNVYSVRYSILSACTSAENGWCREPHCIWQRSNLRCDGCVDFFLKNVEQKLLTHYIDRYSFWN